METLADFLGRIDQAITVPAIAGQLHVVDGALAFGPLHLGAPFEPLPDVSPLAWPERSTAAPVEGQDHLSRSVAHYSEDSEGGETREHELKVAPTADERLAGVFYTARFRRWSGPGLELEAMKAALTAVAGKPKKATKQLTSWVLGASRLSFRELDHRNWGDDQWSHSFLIELIDEGQKGHLGAIAGLRDHQFAKL